MIRYSVSSCLAAMILSSVSVYAESFSTTEYISVTHSVPSYETVNEEIPTEKCYDVKEKVENGGVENADIVGAIGGGAVGGVVGHQFGGGRGKTAATVGGAILGTLAGHSIGSQYNTPAKTTYKTVRKCETTYSTKSTKVVTGYRNVAKFKGHELSVDSDQPLKQIPVTITYSY